MSRKDAMYAKKRREADICELLRFETRREVHGFLKEHSVFLHYTEETSNMIVQRPARSQIGHGSSAARIIQVGGPPDDRHCRHRPGQLPDSDWRDRNPAGALSAGPGFLLRYARNSKGRALRTRCGHGLPNMDCQPPVWLEIRRPGRSPGADLAHLDAGERDAILLAEELGADQSGLARCASRRRLGVNFQKAGIQNGHAG